MAFPTTPIRDDFNRANGDVGSDWTSPVVFFATSERLSISSNQLVFSTGAGLDGNGYWNGSTFGPNAEVYLDFPTVSGTAVVLLRVANPGAAANGYGVGFSFGGAVVRIYRLDNGSLVELGSDISATIANGDALGASMVGDTITAYRRTGGVWASLGSRTDSTFTDAGWIGVYSDDTTVRGDNFGGGNGPLAYGQDQLRELYKVPVARAAFV